MTESEGIDVVSRAMDEIESLREQLRSARSEARYHREECEAAQAEIDRLRGAINEVIVKNCNCPPCQILLAALQPPATGQEVPP